MIKKIFVVLVLISTVSFVFAQKGNVFKALSYKESGKLDSLKNLYYRLKHMEKYNLTVEKIKNK